MNKRKEPADGGEGKRERPTKRRKTAAANKRVAKTAVPSTVHRLLMIRWLAEITRSAATLPVLRTIIETVARPLFERAQQRLDDALENANSLLQEDLERKRLGVYSRKR